MRPDTAELVNSGKGADRRMIFNCDVSRQRCRIGQDDVIAKHAVVRNMCRNHKKVMVPDYCVSAAALVPRWMLTYSRKTLWDTDRKKRVFTAEFEILRLQSDRSERERNDSSRRSSSALQQSRESRIGIRLRF